MATVINPRVADVPVAGEVYKYLTGFGNEHESEALAGALPQGRFFSAEGGLRVVCGEVKQYRFHRPA